MKCTEVDVGDDGVDTSVVMMEKKKEKNWGFELPGGF
jgi:hypothetical protein